jgi:hypothetical protein
MGYYADVEGVYLASARQYIQEITEKRISILRKTPRIDIGNEFVHYVLNRSFGVSLGPDIPECNPAWLLRKVNPEKFYEIVDNWIEMRIDILERLSIEVLSDKYPAIFIVQDKTGITDLESSLSDGVLDLLIELQEYDFDIKELY